MAISDSTAERYTAHDPDVRLMLRVRDDDAEAFEELMLRYQNRVVSLLAHITGHRDMAEDLAQDVFLRIYRARKRYIPVRSFRPGCLRSSHNVASNAQRTLSRRKEVHLAAQQCERYRGQRPRRRGGRRRAIRCRRGSSTRLELRDAVNVAVASLNERQREAVLLNKFEHLSYEEIAEVMEMTPSAVKSLLTRARSNLRDVLEPYLQQGTKVE